MPRKNPPTANRNDSNQGTPRDPPPDRGDGRAVMVEHPTFKDQADSVAPSQQAPFAPVPQPPVRQHAGDPPSAELLPSFKDQAREVEHLDDEEIGGAARKLPAGNATNQSESSAAQMQQQQHPAPQQQQQQLETDASFVPLAQGIPVSLDHDSMTTPPPTQPEGTPAIKKHIVWGMVVVVVVVVVAVAAVVGFLLSSNSSGSGSTTVLSPTDSNPTTAGEPAVSTTVSPTPPPQIDDSSTQTPVHTSTPPPTPPPRPATPQPTKPFPVATPSPTMPPTTPPQQSVTASPITNPEPTTGDNINPGIIPVEVAKVMASGGAAGDRFGFRVAIDGDTIVIGKISGSPYVFTLSGDVWTEQAKLTASDGADVDTFGRSMAVNGDTIVIGARWDDTENGIKSGSAYVYTRSGTVWTEQTKLTASDGAADDYFGNSVAMDGDTIVIGAYWGDAKRGSVYVYTGSGSVWTEQAKLTASDGARFFGDSVAVDGGTIVVGFWVDGIGENGGIVNVYTGSGTVWTEQAKLTASDGTVRDNFGGSLAVDGDTIAIGAPRWDDTWDGTGNGNRYGSAYVYTRSGTVWTEQAKLTASDGAYFDQFGRSVAMDGDTIAIGVAYVDTESGSNSGSVYVYTRSGTVWTEQAKLTASDAAAGDQFGYSVAMDGGILVVGADDDDTASGSAYIFA